jgi:Lhr-like helicase
MKTLRYHRGLIPGDIIHRKGEAWRVLKCNGHRVTMQPVRKPWVTAEIELKEEV